MNQLSSSTPSRQTPLAFLYDLIRAHPTVESPAERRQAELLAALSLASALADLFFVILSLFLGQWTVISIGVLIFGVVSFITYLMSRSTRHGQASLLFIGGFIPAAYLVSFVAPVSIIVPIITFTFLFLLSNLLKLKWMAGVVLVNALLAILGSVFFLPDLQGIEALLTSVALAALSVFVLLFAWHRENLEKLRLDEILSSQKDLELSNLELQQAQQQVSARLNEIKLAAEVGRAISQVRVLDDMLDDAVERIRAQFNLYYTQVYLINPSQTFLEMEAGTGEVGQKLRQAGHKLALKANSINGRAALEKRPVVVSETTDSPSFKPNPLLPATRSEMAVPLIVGGQVIGVLDMQSEQSGTLSEAILPAFEALAGQLAIAIQNARLLEEAEKSYVELQRYSARLSRENWAEYLDAIYKPETIGFVFEQGEIHALTEGQVEDDTELKEAILIGGAPLGSLTVKIPENAPQAQATQLLALVSSRVAQQIENLRLLESAERYRLEAEQASRRLTREGWEEYFREKTGQSLSYLYDLKEVRLHKTGLTKEIEAAINVPIKVRDENIGKLSVMGLDASDADSLNLINTVSERLAEHLESLRLLEETQQGQLELNRRAEQLAAVSEISTVSSRELDIQKMLATVVHLTQRKFDLYHAHIFTYDEANKNLQIIACGWKEGDEHQGTHGTTTISIDQEQSLVARAARNRAPVVVNNVRNEPGWLPNEFLPDTASELAVPLVIGDEILGVLDVQSDQMNAFNDEDVSIQMTLAAQIATALQNARSFARAQRQADREAMLNAISQKIQSATSVEAVLQIAARELGHALGAPRTIAQLSLKDK